MGRKSAGFKQCFVDRLSMSNISSINRKLCLFLFQGAFPCNGTKKWKDTFCLRERSISSLHEWLKWWDAGGALALHMGALFFSVAGGFPQFHIPICHLTLDLTEKAPRPWLTSCQPLKTSSSDHQNFLFGLMQNQPGIPSAGIEEWCGFEELSMGMAESAWLEFCALPVTHTYYFRGWESGTWHSFLPQPLSMHSTVSKELRVLQTHNLLALVVGWFRKV